MENQTIIGKKMNRGIYAITAIGESLSGEKNLVLILEIIRNCGKNVIGENKKMHYVISDIHNDYQKFFTEEKSMRYYGFELGTNTEKIKEK
mgnify:FL=1